MIKRDEVGTLNRISPPPRIRTQRERQSQFQVAVKFLRGRADER